VKALGPGAMPSLRLSQFGGEPLTQGVVEAWRRSAPASEIRNLYGPTEVTVTCMSQRIVEPLDLAPGSDVLAIGQPLDGCEAAIWGPQGEPLAEGQVGELVLAGVQLASGYLDDPQRTAERFVWRDGLRWYRTGDLAMRDAAGRYHCLGRMDHQVKVRGHRVELEEVDAHLRQVLGESMVATVAWPRTGSLAQGLVAFTSGRLGEAEAVQALRERLPAYMVPARVLSLAQLPTNANGKVDRQVLVQWLDAGQVG
jgi:D-alanine--poly(phosphoribitol) ligase subunit 1